MKTRSPTYTGIDWQFFHFGPWSSAVNARVEPAAGLIDASLRTFSATDEYKEGKRFSVSQHDADPLERKLERELPSVIVSTLKKAVHDFGTDTPRLLDWVYKTPPMLKAAPKEMLDFTHAVEVARPVTEPEISVSRRHEKKMKEWLAAARKTLAENRASRTTEKRERIEPDPIDEVTARGMAWLNEDSVVEPASGVARFSEDVWRAAGWPRITTRTSGSGGRSARQRSVWSTSRIVGSRPAR